MEVTLSAYPDFLQLLKEQTKKPLRMPYLQPFVYLVYNTIIEDRDPRRNEKILAACQGNLGHPAATVGRRSRFRPPS